jgi:hypothetical protein
MVESEELFDALNLQIWTAGKSGALTFVNDGSNIDIDAEKQSDEVLQAWREQQAIRGDNTR